MATLRIVLADDHEAVRAGVRTRLARELDLDVVGEASTGEEAWQVCLAVRPSVLLLDLGLPGPSAAEILARIRQHHLATRVVILSAHGDGPVIQNLLNLGIVGYVLKEDSLSHVVSAVRAAAVGDTWLSSHAVVELERTNLVAVRPHFSARQEEVLRLLSHGLSNVQIAAELDVREQTVRNYLSQIYRKLNVTSRSEAILWWQEQCSGR